MVASSGEIDSEVFGAKVKEAIEEQEVARRRAEYRRERLARAGGRARDILTSDTSDLPIPPLFQRKGGENHALSPLETRNRLFNRSDSRGGVRRPPKMK